MNDKSLNVLEHYDISVNKTFKGRGTIICETDAGKFVLKEYKGKTEKLELLDRLQKGINPVVKTDSIVRSKEGELYVKENDNNVYILKQHIEGRECNYKSEEDIEAAFRVMAQLHMTFRDMYNIRNDTGQYQLPIFYYAREMQRHTTECTHIRNYLKKLKIKNDFERLLLKEYDYFLDKAVSVTQRALAQSKEQYEEYVLANGFYCHGDFQYHNILFISDNESQRGRNGRQSANCAVINFEHFAKDTGVRDIYLLLRKICEKNDWSIQKGYQMLDAYQNIRPLNDMEWNSLLLRMEYPEKFWKIANFYYNSRKSWISERNYEKLEKLICQEKNKEQFIRKIFY